MGPSALEIAPLFIPFCAFFDGLYLALDIRHLPCWQLCYFSLSLS